MLSPKVRSNETSLEIPSRICGLKKQLNISLSSSLAPSPFLLLRGERRTTRAAPFTPRESQQPFNPTHFDSSTKERDQRKENKGEQRGQNNSQKSLQRENKCSKLIIINVVKRSGVIREIFHSASSSFCKEERDEMRGEGGVGGWNVDC